MWWPSLQSIILWSKSFSWLENNVNLIWLSHYSDNRCDLTLRRSHSCVEFWYILIVRATMMRLNIFRIENQAKSPLSGTPFEVGPLPSRTKTQLRLWWRQFGIFQNHQFYEKFTACKQCACITFTKYNKCIRMWIGMMRMVEVWSDKTKLWWKVVKILKIWKSWFSGPAVVYHHYKSL